MKFYKLILFYKINNMSNKTKNNEEEVDIQNLQLRNYFQNRIEKYEPSLILKKKQGNYNAYSRLCQSNQKRQPVLLSESEMENIVKEYPEYADPKYHIKYGTEDKQYTYICPKYWNMKTNKPISEADMDAKNLRSFIIPRGAKKVTSNAYIYEFVNDKGIHYPYPNFIEDKHPDGHCLPCCFQDFDTAKRKMVRDQCMNKGAAAQPKTSKMSSKEQKITDEEESEAEADYESEPEEKELPQTKKVAPPLTKKEKGPEYVTGADRFPLKYDRWGHIPISLQKLLEQDNSKCQISTTNENLQYRVPCLLRYGVNSDEKGNQSFLECIAHAVGRPSVENLKLDIIDLFLTLDNFMLVQNGNLVIDFYDPTISYSDIPEDIRKLIKLESTYFRHKMNRKDPDEIEMFKKICVSYYNFRKYLESPDTKIDHTYMWDIVSMHYHIILCIFEIPDNDITDNIEVLCPTNHYSKNIISSTDSDILIIVKKNNFYEPVYTYTRNVDGAPTIKQMFSRNDPTANSVSKILRRIIKFIQKECRPKVFEAMEPTNIHTALSVFNQSSYEVLTQVINYDGKVIGLLVRNNKLNITCLVPVQPTGILYKTYTEINMPYMDSVIVITDPSIPVSYEDTLKFYETMCTTTRKRIPCKLVYKVLEDEMVVGFLTETNQFVMINPPIPFVDTEEDGIPPLNEIIPENPHIIDKKIALTKEGDIDLERTQYVAKLKAESFQYSIFKNTIKVLLTINKKNRREVIDLLEGGNEEYDQDEEPPKVNREVIMNALKQLASSKIIFVDQEQLPTPLEEVSLVNEEPIYLLNGENNERKYYEKIADDLIRNTRFQRYLLDTSVPVVIEKDEYDIAEDEIIINESMVASYFDGLGTEEEKNTRYTSYDESVPFNVEQYRENDRYNFHDVKDTDLEEPVISGKKKPIISGKKTSKLMIEDEGEYKNEDDEEFIIVSKKKPIVRSMDRSMECPVTKYGIIGELGKIFSTKTNRLVQFNCTYGIFQALLPQPIPEDEIRRELIAEYDKYKKYEEILIRILSKQGKRELMEELRSLKLRIKDIIESHNYFLTTLDLWLLCSRYKIPCMLLSTRKDKRSNLLESNRKSKAFVLYGTAEDEMAVIVVPGIKQKPGSLRLLQQKHNDTERSSYFYMMEAINSELLESALENPNNVEGLAKWYMVKENRVGLSKDLDDMEVEEVNREKKVVVKPAVKKSNIIIAEDEEEYI